MVQGIVPEDLQLLATTTFNTSTALRGFFGVTGATIVTARLDFVSVDLAPVRFQVRVWDSRDGSIATWASALADPTVPNGYSDEFVSPVRLAPNLAEPLYGMTSFTLVVVPEPSVIALASVAAVAALVCWRHRRSFKSADR